MTNSHIEEQERRAVAALIGRTVLVRSRGRRGTVVGVSPCRLSGHWMVSVAFSNDYRQPDSCIDVPLIDIEA